MRLKADFKLAHWHKVAPQYYGQTYVNSLIVFNGKIYAGTYMSALLFEWNGKDSWVLKAPPLGSPHESEICSLVAFNEKIYGGTAQHARLYEWNGVNAWVEKAGQFGDETYISSLVVYNGKIYGGTAPHGKLLEWNGVNAWVEKAGQFGEETDISSMKVYNGKLYGGTYPHGKLLEWNGVNAWVEKAGQFGGESDISSLLVYNGKLYGGGFGTGRLLEWNGTNAWIERAPQSGNAMITSLCEFYGKLVAGTFNYNVGVDYDGGKLLEWDGASAWIERAQTLHSQNEILSLVVLDNNLYAGTSPDGMLFQLDWMRPGTAKTDLVEKVYIIPPDKAVDKSQLNNFGVSWSDYKFKSVQRDGTLSQRELEVTLSRNTPVTRYSTVIFAIDGQPKFRGFVEQIVDSLEKRKILCKGNEAKLSYRFASKKAYVSSWYNSPPRLGSLLLDIMPYCEPYEDGPGALCDANSYIPPGTPYTIYDSTKNIVVLKYMNTKLDFRGRSILVRLNGGMSPLTQCGALADLQNTDYAYYIDANNDIFIRVQDSNWYAVGGLFAHNIVDTGVRLGSVETMWRFITQRLYIGGEEIAELLSNIARSNDLAINITDSWEYTYLNFGASGRGEGTGVLTLFERDLLELERSTSSKPHLRAIIGSGEANQYYTAYDNDVASGLFGKQTFEGAYASEDWWLPDLTSAALRSNNSADIWKIKVRNEKVRHLCSGDYLRIKLPGEKGVVLPISQYELTPDKATLQLGGRVPGFSDAWDARNALPVFGEHLIELYPEESVDVANFKPSDLNHNCNAGTATLNVPADILEKSILILLGVSAHVDHPLAATQNVWRFKVLVGGKPGKWGIVDEVPLGEAIQIDVTDLVAAGDNTITIYAKYYSVIETQHDTCVSGYQIPMAPWIPDSYYVGHPDLKVNLTMKFYGLV